MIYAVGITLVVVIALMLTNPRLEQESSTSVSGNSKYIGALVALLLFITIYMSLRTESFPITAERPALPNLLLLGSALMTTYALPFEFASVLLLAALVGAIAIAKVDQIRRR